jgi:hypothetical protein
MKPTKSSPINKQKKIMMLLETIKIISINNNINNNININTIKIQINLNNINIQIEMFKLGIIVDTKKNKDGKIKKKGRNLSIMFIKINKININNNIFIGLVMINIIMMEY